MCVCVCVCCERTTHLVSHPRNVAFFVLLLTLQSEGLRRLPLPSTGHQHLHLHQVFYSCGSFLTLG